MTNSIPTTSREVPIWILVGVVVVAAATRLIPHPPNFTPVGAMALFAGATLCGSRRRFRLPWPRRLGTSMRGVEPALVVPLVALLISDIAIGQVYGPGFGLHRSQLFVYGAFLLITLLGRTLQNHRRSPIRIVAASLSASVLFFVVTNFGVWLTSGMYAHTPADLLRCYIQAIPFFGNTVTGDLVFSMLFFGGLAYFEKYVHCEQSAPVLSDDA